MKTVILALLVTLAVSQGEALRCYRGGKMQCSGSVQTCYGSNLVCASVIITAGSTVSYFQSCMGANDCSNLNVPGISTARCCETDLCNG